MTHEQLVEKVARLIVGAQYDRDPSHKTRVTTAREDARAILSLIADALGEPTPEMLLAMSDAMAAVAYRNVYGMTFSEIRKMEARAYLAAMLDASPLKAGGSPR